MWIFKAIIFLIFILISVSFFSINSQLIDIRFFPVELSRLSTVVSVPLYVVMLIFIFIGLFLGTLSEYLRSLPARRVSKKRLEEVEKLNDKVKNLTRETSSETNEILGLLK